MAIDSFFNDILPAIDGLVSDFIRGDTDSTHNTLRDKLSVRADIATELKNASTHMGIFVAQQAYDAASVIDRQLSIINSTRAAYFEAATKERDRLSKYYGDVRSHGNYFQQIAPSYDNGQDSFDEPYLDANGNIVFDE